jgi:hypothetical protein
MKIKYKIFLPVIPLMVLLTGCGPQSGEITLETLLNEMTDRERLAKYPDPEYTCKQFSSYNITSTRPGHYSWFANLDNNYFIRTENNEGRREFVLFDAGGPGSVVRFWATFARYDRGGTLRFYFDGEEVPRIEGEAMEILSGGGLVGAPLSFSVSEDCDYSRRGHNLYLPVPYANHLKITYESEGIPEARDGIDEEVKPGEEMFYYQINYRTYKPGTKVESFEKENLVTYSQAIEETQLRIVRRDRGLDGLQLETIAFSDTLAPNEKSHVTIKGSQAIRRMKLKLNADNLEQALRSTVLQVAFDGEQTIWAPVGDFFGTGYRIVPFHTWYQKVNSDGTMEVYWIMPFRKSCELEVINFGDQVVEITNGEISSSAWKWDKRSMHFGSSWYQNTRINSGLVKKRDGQGDMYDIKYTTLNGKGVYVGDALTLFNCTPAWWGEGDEKIFIDNEDFPSHFGTGTEDYYGYAWCRPETFIHPFISQPHGSGNLGIGYTLDMRYRCLDAIPFRERLQFDMEMWHWGYTIMNHAPVTFWYMRPNGECEIQPDIEGVKEEVVLKREQIFPPVMNEQNILEGEDLVITEITGNGSVRIRPVPVPDEPNWTRAAHMWFDAASGDAIRFRFISTDPGRTQITASMLSPKGKPGLSFYINDQKVLVTSIRDNNTQGDQVLDFQPVELLSGDNELRIEIHGSPAVEDAVLGIDYLKFNPM